MNEDAAAERLNAPGKAGFQKKEAYWARCDLIDFGGTFLDELTWLSSSVK